jgi:hypothetical protein
LRRNFVCASRAGKRAARTEARARFVVYRAREHALRIELTNGVAIAYPVKLIPDLRRAARCDVRPPPPRLLQRAETGAEAVVRAFGPRRVRWNLDASPVRYYLMTTYTVSTKSADGRYKPETP